MSRRTGLQEGVVAIITGASSGIGRSLAVSLAKKYKAKIALNARSAELLEQAAAEVRAAGGEAITVVGSVAERPLVQRLVDECVAKFGRADLLVNNAGYLVPGSVVKLTPDDWRAVFDVNFFGALECIYAVLPKFLEQGSGKIVNISSVAGKVTLPGNVCYASSKFAMTAMSEGMAGELCHKNIDTITVCPGWIRTNFFKSNQMPETRNPTAIAEKNDLPGWIMRELLSMSAEDCAEQIVKACEAGGSREIILTAPGKFIEGLNRLAPNVVSALGRLRVER